MEGRTGALGLLVLCQQPVDQQHLPASRLSAANARLPLPVPPPPLLLLLRPPWLPARRLLLLPAAACSRSCPLAACYCCARS